MAANSAVHSPIWPNFELIRDVIIFLITCKIEEDPIKNDGARVFTALYINFSDAQGQITPELVLVSGRNSYTFKLSYMFLLSARIKMIELKMKELECSNQFSRRSRTANSAVLGPIWSNFELVSDVMDVLVTCKNKEDPIKMKPLEWSQDFPHYNPMGAICCHRNQSSDST